MYFSTFTRRFLTPTEPVQGGLGKGESHQLHPALQHHVPDTRQEPEGSGQQCKSSANVTALPPTPHAPRLTAPCPPRLTTPRIFLAETHVAQKYSQHFHRSLPPANNFRRSAVTDAGHLFLLLRGPEV